MITECKEYVRLLSYYMILDVNFQPIYMSKIMFVEQRSKWQNSLSEEQNVDHMKTVNGIIFYHLWWHFTAYGDAQVVAIS